MAENRLGPIIESAINKLVTMASASGYFDRTQAYEPKSNPGTGLTFATWLANIKPIPLHSGLDATSARTMIMCRIYLPMLTDPQDTIDTRLGVAGAYVMTELSADFLGPDQSTSIDLLGAYGEALECGLGYVPLDNAHYRIVDIPVPFISPDVFDQEA